MIKVQSAGILHQSWNGKHSSRMMAGNKCWIIKHIHAYIYIPIKRRSWIDLVGWVPILLTKSQIPTVRMRWYGYLYSFGSKEGKEGGEAYKYRPTNLDQNSPPFFFVIPPPRSIFFLFFFPPFYIKLKSKGPFFS